MAFYTMRKLPHEMLGEGERLFPKLITNGTASNDDIARTITQRTGLSRGDVIAVMTELADAVANSVAEGKSVKVNGLGTFKAVVGLVDKEERTAWLDAANRLTTARNVKLKTVNFRPARDLVEAVGHAMTLERVGGTSHDTAPTATEQERLSMACRHIARHGFLRVADYARLTSQPKTTASRDLRRLAEKADSGIKADGTGPARVYVASSAKRQ